MNVSKESRNIIILHLSALSCHIKSLYTYLLTFTDQTISKPLDNSPKRVSSPQDALCLLWQYSHRVETGRANLIGRIYRRNNVYILTDLIVNFLIISTGLDDKNLVGMGVILSHVSCLSVRIYALHTAQIGTFNISASVFCRKCRWAFTGWIFPVFWSWLKCTKKMPPAHKIEAMCLPWRHPWCLSLLMVSAYWY